MRRHGELTIHGWYAEKIEREAMEKMRLAEIEEAARWMTEMSRPITPSENTDKPTGIWQAFAWLAFCFVVAAAIVMVALWR